MVAVTLNNGNPVIVLRIPRSWTAPHMVLHRGVTRFCGRNSGGKYDLDVHQVRAAFLASEGIADRLKNFRLERVNRLISGTVPVVLTSSHLVVFHLLPIVSARPDVRLSTADFQQPDVRENLIPMGGSPGSLSFNIDGLLLMARWGNVGHHGFVQMFRMAFSRSWRASYWCPARKVSLPFGLPRSKGTSSKCSRAISRH